MTTSTPLSTFPPALARLLLCGGGGLPAAYGPVLVQDDYHGRIDCVWDGQRWAVGYAGHETDGRWCLDDLEPGRSRPRAFLPLESSPWPARMAVVAAWMLEEPCDYASVDRRTNNGWIILRIHDRFRSQAADHRWLPTGGPVTARLFLPTLPTHLAQHPPEVALLLSLYDVPEVKARVEALQ